MKEHTFELIEFSGISAVSIVDAVNNAIKRARKTIKILCRFTGECMQPLAFGSLLLSGAGTDSFGGTYSTTFSGSGENPISEGGRWINGRSTGLDWSDCAITNHMAIGYQTDQGPGGNAWNDSTAVLSGSWGPTQTVRATLWFDRTGTLNQNYCEAELRLRTSISAHSCTGYEIDYCANVLPFRSGYVYIVRWNGPFADFIGLNAGVSGTQYDLHTGDVISATITNTSANSATISAYINGTLVLTATDNNCFNSGSPGIGFDMAGDLTQRVKYGFTSFTASDGQTTTLPVVTQTSPLNGASYVAPATINLAADVVTNGHTITKVQFYNGATLLGEDTSAPYSFTWNNVSAGSYNLSAQAVYDVGSMVASASANVTVTNPPPTVALTAPLTGASYTAPATVNLAASVTANGHTITRVQFYNGATLLGEDTSAPYSFTWNNVSVGSYSLSAQAVYDAGSMVASTPVSVTVTNPPPSVALTTPVDGASYTAPATVNLAAAVTANGHTITKVQFYNGATLLGEDASSPYSFTWNNVSAGSYSLSAQAVYDAGSMVASASAGVTVTNPPPSVALTAPLSGASYTAPATVNLAAAVTANGHTITKVQFYNGATLLGEDTSAPYSFTWNNVSVGSYNLSAQAAYDAGSMVASASANVTVTNPPPSVGFGGTYSTTFSGSGENPISEGGRWINGKSTGLDWSDCAITNHMAIGYQTDQGPGGNAWNDSTAVLSGSWGPTQTVRATLWFDRTGTLNQNYCEAELRLRTSISAHSCTGYEIDYCANVLPFRSGYVYIVRWNGPFADFIGLNAGVSGTQYDLHTGDVISATITNTSANSATISAYINGTLVLTATDNNCFNSGSPGIGFDMAGDLTQRVKYGFTSFTASDGQTTTLPVVTQTSPLNGASYVAPATINLAADVVTNGHTITKVQFYNGVTLLGDATVAPYSFTWNNVSAGSYSLSAQAVYDAGSMVASASANVTVTNPPPTVALTAPLTGASYTAPATVNLAASVTANGHTITKVQFYNGVTLLGDATVAPYSFTWNNVSAGSYSLSAQAVYDAGSMVASASANVTVTNPPPTVALTAPLTGASYTAPATVNLAVAVTANGHTITKVQFYNGATLLGEDTSAPYSFTWNNVSAGSYNLSAQAVYDAGSMVASASACVTMTNPPPSVALPAPWQTVDIGSVGLVGGASMSNGIYTVKGAGNLSKTADNFRFVHQPLSADGEIKVRLDSVENTGASGGIGVMIRESLTSGSKCAFMGISPDGTFRWQRRSNTGGSTVSTTSSVGTPPNVWMRLTRTGATLRGYKSTDGITWTQVNSHNIIMGTDIYIGLAVASGSSNTLNTATFSSMTVIP